MLEDVVVNTAVAHMQKASFFDASEYKLFTIGRVTKRLVTLEGASALLIRFPVGASVYEDGVKTGLLDTDVCTEPHIAYILSGTLGVRQQDGSEEHFTAGDLMMLPPGHEAWTIGEKDCVFVEFMRGTSDVYDYWPER
jgi:ethanolamine utilization protein EutQ (cupin superfamily)